MKSLQQAAKPKNKQKISRKKAPQCGAFFVHKQCKKNNRKIFVLCCILYIFAKHLKSIFKYKTMKNILIIGAGGQIGSELTRNLRDIYGDNHVICSDLRPLKGQDYERGPIETTLLINI